MNPEELFTLGVMGAGAVGSLWAATRSWRMSLRETQAVAAVWSEWARRRGLGYEPPTTSWSPTAPRVRGFVEGVFLSLDGMVLDPHQTAAPSASRQERGRMPHTTLAARAQGNYEGEMLISSRALVDAPLAALGYRQMDLADARFDEACALYAGPSSPAHRLGDRAVRAALVHLAQRPFVLFAHGPSLWVRWPGFERDPAVLDHAAAALVGLARGSS